MRIPVGVPLPAAVGRVCYALLALGALLASSAQAQAIEPVRTYFNLQANAEVVAHDGHSDGQNFNYLYDSNSLPLSVVGGALSANAANNGGSANASASGASDWLNPNSGTVLFFSSYDSAVLPPQPGVGASGGGVGTSGRWQYQFETTSADNTFQLAYAVSGQGAYYSNGGGARYFPPGSTTDVGLANHTSGIITTPLSAVGGYRAELWAPGANATGAIGTDQGYSQSAFVWGINGLPGLAADSPLLPHTTGSDFGFSIPVIDGGYGTDETVFIDPDAATGYHYVVAGTHFASVLIPASLPLGDGDFELLFNGLSVPLHAGVAYDFTALLPDGVTDFTILGIDPTEMLSPEDPLAFVTGLTFTTAGVADVTMTAVPEPSSLVLAAVGFVGLTLLARRRNAK